MDKWLQIIWIDEATFEIDLDIRLCFVTRKKETVMEAKYLKPTFKMTEQQ